MSYSTERTRTLSAQPVIYEIDTWVWLDDLSRRFGRRIALDGVPANIWDAIALSGIDAVWLMGVWERSPAAIRVARENAGSVSSFVEALPDYEPDDVVGSPYAVRQYVVDASLGGPRGLAKARDELAHRNLGLVLDYVPNHVAIDNAWTATHAEYFRLF